MSNKFSIIIPTFNNADYLELCINSILKNSFYKHQLIIHINGSDKDTEILLSKKNISYSKTDTNIGLCSYQTIFLLAYILLAKANSQPAVGRLFVSYRSWDETVCTSGPCSLSQLSQPAVTQRPSSCWQNAGIAPTLDRLRWAEDLGEGQEGHRRSRRDG